MKPAQHWEFDDGACLGGSLFEQGPCGGIGHALPDALVRAGRVEVFTESPQCPPKMAIASRVGSGRFRAVSTCSAGVPVPITGELTNSVRKPGSEGML